MKTKVDLLLSKGMIEETFTYDKEEPIMLCDKCFFELTCERKKGMPCMSTMREDKKSIYYKEI